MRALNRLLAETLPAFPKRLVHLVARRYVAGATLPEALACVARLNDEGARASVDILGENVLRREQCTRTRDAYIEVLTALERQRADASVSIKLTALGLKLDPALCRQNVVAILEVARGHGRFVRIDMEDSTCTEATLQLHESLRAEFDNVGPVLQACLRRTVSDARALAAMKANVRLCKGIYDESREIAWKDRDIVRRNFAEILKVLFEGGCHVGIATHDELLVWEAIRLIDEMGLHPSRYEFQMLLGVEEQLRRILIRAGHPLRVYVPFGEHWYEYSLRRLKENPEVAGHVARATVARFLGRDR